MNYTHYWNGTFVENVNKLNINNLDLCLEIGCFEGLTSNYIADNLLSPKGKLICVDPLTDNYLNNNLTGFDVENNNTIYKYFNNQYERFISNTQHYVSLGKIELYRDISELVFPKLIEKYENLFDLIYIDGDHRASAVYIDAVNSLKLCKPNGYIIFDDYAWGEMYNEESTRVGIDKFLNEYSGQYELMLKDYQITIKKL
jgi:predicted O-methyltransferase YrrM